MVSISELVGTIPHQDKVPFVGENKEKFYKFNASFDDVDIPVVVSCFIWNDDYFGKVKVTGYLDTMLGDDGRYTQHIYAHSLKSVPPDEPDTKEITLCARITKLGDIFPTSNGVDMRRVVTTQTTYTGKTAVITIMAKKSAARVLGGYNKGDYIRGVGILTKHKNRYQVIVETVPVLPEQEDMKQNG